LTSEVVRNDSEATIRIAAAAACRPAEVKSPAIDRGGRDLTTAENVGDSLDAGRPVAISRTNRIASDSTTHPPAAGAPLAITRSSTCPAATAAAAAISLKE
jgi:hypothetical protein